MSRIPRSGAVLFFLLLCLLPSGCGSGGGGQGAEPTRFEGLILDLLGQPVSNVEVYLFETNESSLTDDSGAFFLESYKHLNRGSFFFRTSEFTNRVDLGSFPADALVVRPQFLLDTEGNGVSLAGVSFSSDLTPPAEPTPTAVPGQTPAPSASPTPKPLFDAAGNTSAFGIPSGLQGNINAGRPVWNNLCVSCHATEKRNRSYGQIKASARIVPTMQDLNLSNQQIADVTAYLNRNRR